MDQTDQGTDELISSIMGEVSDRMRHEDEAIAAARAVPPASGPCPGAGLRAYSAGGYSHLMCPVCWSILGAWTWEGPDENWPKTPEHDRAEDTPPINLQSTDDPE